MTEVLENVVDWFCPYGPVGLFNQSRVLPAQIAIRVRRQPDAFLVIGFFFAFRFALAGGI